MKDHFRKFMARRRSRCAAIAEHVFSYSSRLSVFDRGNESIGHSTVVVFSRSPSATAIVAAVVRGGLTRSVLDGTHEQQ